MTQREPLLLETTDVGRKTPVDGKLEIRPATAESLRALGDSVPLRICRRGAPPREGLGRIARMACTCGKAGATGSHEHHFLESMLLRDLDAGTTLSLILSASDRVELHLIDRDTPSPPPPARA